MKNTIVKNLSGKTKKLSAAMVIGYMTMMSSLNTFAAGDKDADLSKVTSPIMGLLETVLNVMIPLVGAIGAIFCVFLGIKYSRAEEPQEREKAKQHLKSAIIGFVLIFVLIVALRIGLPIMIDWMNANS